MALSRSTRFFVPTDVLLIVSRESCCTLNLRTASSFATSLAETPSCKQHMQQASVECAVCDGISRTVFGYCLSCCLLDFCPCGGAPASLLNHILRTLLQQMSSELAFFQYSASCLQILLRSDQPIGQFMSHSTHVGFRLPPTCSLNGLLFRCIVASLALPLSQSRAVGVGNCSFASL